LKLNEELVNGYKKIQQTDDEQTRLSLYWILHTSHNDFCLSQIPVLWHVCHRSYVMWTLGRRLGPPKNFGMAPLWIH